MCLAARTRVALDADEILQVVAQHRIVLGQGGHDQRAALAVGDRLARRGIDRLDDRLVLAQVRTARVLTRRAEEREALQAGRSGPVRWQVRGLGHAELDRIDPEPLRGLPEPQQRRPEHLVPVRADLLPQADRALGVGIGRRGTDGEVQRAVGLDRAAQERGAAVQPGRVRVRDDLAGRVPLAGEHPPRGVVFHLQVVFREQRDRRPPGRAGRGGQPDASFDRGAAVRAERRARGLGRPQVVLGRARDPRQVVDAFDVVPPDPGLPQQVAEVRDRPVEEARDQGAQPLLLQRAQLRALQGLDLGAVEVGHRARVARGARAAARPCHVRPSRAGPPSPCRSRSRSPGRRRRSGRRRSGSRRPPCTSW